MPVKKERERERDAQDLVKTASTQSAGASESLKLKAILCIVIHPGSGTEFCIIFCLTFLLYFFCKNNDMMQANTESFNVTQVLADVVSAG